MPLTNPPGMSIIFNIVFEPEIPKEEVVDHDDVLYLHREIHFLP